MKWQAEDRKEAVKIADFARKLSDKDCRNFVEDVIQNFTDAETAKDFGNITARTLHMYGYEIYPRLKEWTNQ